MRESRKKVIDGRERERERERDGAAREGGKRGRDSKINMEGKGEN